MKRIVFYIVYLLLIPGSYCLAQNFEESGSTLFTGYFRAFTKHDNYGYGGSYSVQIISLTDLSHPEMVGGCHLPSELRGIVVEDYPTGTFAFAACLHDGLATIDVNNPKQPQLVSQIDLPGNMWGLAENYPYLYAISGAWGFPQSAGWFFIFDISDPLNIQLLYTFEYNDAFMSVAYSGNYVFLGGYRGGLKVIDVSDPTLPLHVFTYDALEMPVTGISIRGPFLYFLTDNLTVLNISVPEYPVYLATINIYPSYIMVLDDYLYSISGQPDYDLQIYDIADIHNPELIGSYIGNYSMSGICIEGLYGYIPTGTGLYTFDLSAPENPDSLGFYLLPFDNGDIAMADSMTYVISHAFSETEIFGIFTCLNVSNSREPNILSKIRLPFWRGKIDICGNFAYLALLDSGMCVINIGDPSNPSITNSYRRNDRIVYDIKVQGRYAYQVDGDLEVLDISTPRVQLRSATVTPDESSALTISGDYVYLTGGAQENGLLVYDISDPQSPALASNLNIGSQTLKSVVFENYLYVNCESGETYIVDIHNPLQPNIISQYSWSHRSLEMNIQASHIFSAEGDSGISITYLSDPLNPIHLENFFENTGVIGVAASDIAIGASTHKFVSFINWPQSSTEDNNTSKPISCCEINNHPNPFNANTTIVYSLPKDSNIEIAIYDITGRKIETLIQERQKTGEHSVTWNADGFSSGIYFYKITGEGFSQTKSCVLLK